MALIWHHQKVMVFEITNNHNHLVSKKLQHLVSKKLLQSVQVETTVSIGNNSTPSKTTVPKSI